MPGFFAFNSPKSIHTILNNLGLTCRNGAHSPFVAPTDPPFEVKISSVRHANLRFFFPRFRFCNQFLPIYPW